MKVSLETKKGFDLSKAINLHVGQALQFKVTRDILLRVNTDQFLLFSDSGIQAFSRDSPNVLSADFNVLPEGTIIKIETNS